MPILAHALEEAGCDSQQVLQHCRNESLHVVGCWVLDGVLGRGRSAGGTGESAVTEAGLEGEPEHGN